ncbi:MAG: hypothetical protein IJK18_05225 [Clostridia bacterium]|nr:hypothetical protein [Clostridia bacterium]
MIYGNEEDIYRLYINGKEFYTTDPYSLSSIYIVDFDKNDSSLEVVIKIIGPNDYTIHKVFSKTGNKMNNIKTIDEGWHMKLNKNGKFVIINSLLDCIKPEIYDKYYVFKNNKIEEKSTNIEVLKNKKLKSEGGLCFSLDKNSYKKYIESSYKEDSDDYDNTLEKYGIYYLKNSFNFEFIKFEKGIWINNGIYVKLEDGRKGYLFSHAYNLAG